MVVSDETQVMNSNSTLTVLETRMTSYHLLLESHPEVFNAIYYRPQRSCESYVFTRVCHSVHRWGGGIPACIAGGIPACLAAGVFCSEGGMPAPGGGCLLLGGVETPLKADGYCCRQYASYCNAFLLMTKIGNIWFIIT